MRLSRTHRDHLPDSDSSRSLAVSNRVELIMYSMSQRETCGFHGTGGTHQGKELCRLGTHTAQMSPFSLSAQFGTDQEVTLVRVTDRDDYVAGFDTRPMLPSRGMNPTRWTPTTQDRPLWRRTRCTSGKLPLDAAPSRLDGFERCALSGGAFAVADRIDFRRTDGVSS